MKKTPTMKLFPGKFLLNIVTTVPCLVARQYRVIRCRNLVEIFQFWLPVLTPQVRSYCYDSSDTDLILGQSGQVCHFTLPFTGVVQAPDKKMSLLSVFT